ncbi:uncharacterized protein LOC116020214 [Ipomoea triloba]|uniref:uncharacterized protein LOC116020214 n=1 Tax=Ipomoea triloba TaxID=35885 RepID=UPI00125D82EA|nr:uncharacterized protein LOC116020214 [Ipomoea triloba]
MWDVISDGPILIMKVNPSSIAKDILFKAVDDTIFPKIRKCKTAKDVWDVLIQIGEGDEQEKDNKLTIAMKKFEDFKMLPSEKIADMESRLVKVLEEITDLGKTLDQKEISLKILRGLPSSWDMKVTAMRDHRDLKVVSTDKLFSDLKAYEFEMKSKLEEEREERTTALVAEQPSNSWKFKKFMRKNNFNNSSQRNQGSSSRRPRREFSDDNTNLCYNCRKPGHFMAECPYPKEISESKDRRFKKDKRKALISDPLETSGSEESSSDESDSSTEDTALLCLLSITSESDFQEKCLMAHEVEKDEVTSKSFDYANSSFSRESIFQLMKDCQTVMDTHSQLKERNNSLILEKDKINEKLQDALLEMRNLKAENIRLQEECKAREIREHNLRETIASFTHSSKIMDKMVNMQKPSGDKAGLGYDPTCSKISENLTNSTTSLINKAQVVKFVKSQDSTMRQGIGYQTNARINTARPKLQSNNFSPMQKFRKHEFGSRKRFTNESSAQRPHRKQFPMMRFGRDYPTEEDWHDEIKPWTKTRAYATRGLVKVLLLLLRN